MDDKIILDNAERKLYEGFYALAVDLDMADDPDGMETIIRDCFQDVLDGNLTGGYHLGLKLVIS